MCSCDSRTSTDTAQSLKVGPSPKRRTNSWARNPQQAVVLGLGSRHLSVEDINEANSK